MYCSVDCKLSCSKDQGLDSAASAVKNQKTVSPCMPPVIDTFAVACP